MHKIFASTLTAATAALAALVISLAPVVQAPTPTAAQATKAAKSTMADPKKSPSKTNACKPEKGMSVKVKLTTSMGAITLELNAEKAPISVENFVKYVESGHYSGTIFHRIIDGFMVQGGGMTKNMQQKPNNPPIKNEAANGLKNDLYTVAMARTGVRDSATSQFFINVKNNDFLNYSGETPQGFGYAVFGKVIEGTDVVDKMKSVKTGAQDVPLETITIEKAECL